MSRSDDKIQIYASSRPARRTRALGRPWRPVARPWFWWLLGGFGALGLVVWMYRRRSMSGTDGSGSDLKRVPIVEQPPMIVTLQQLRQIMPLLTIERANLFLPHVNDAMSRAGIVTPLAVAAFLANVAHESGQLSLLSEIWGPSPAQLRYELPALARLGNTTPGDGYKYRGRGALQITGRGAYRAAGNALGMDLEGNPDIVSSDPSAAMLTAAWYWICGSLRQPNQQCSGRSLTPYADAGEFLAVARGINYGNPTSTGTPNGMKQRQEYYDRARAVLGV
jgi:putative chitinase